ncbi:unknown [Clostridium sp. CAG:768]|nr:unknown [Clostridium sp. CAG:768]
MGFDYIKHQGFTLAEVLITLGIIGIVAAMTMPSVIGNARDKQIIARV